MTFPVAFRRPSLYNKDTKLHQWENDMAETNTNNAGFGKQIWDAACVLRGNMDASEYKSVVLGLIFLEYISDRFEARYNELVAKATALKKTSTSTRPRISSLY